LERQHTVPLLLPSSLGGAEPLKPVAQQGGGAVSEAYIQALVHKHPACLPIAKIDPMFSGPVPICTELNTPPAGAIDNFMVTPSGLPVLVECKLWRNPEARREVVGQILDYAKVLSRWSSSDLQREVCRRLNRDGNPMLDMVRQADPQVDERQFNDALTANLRRGRFLLLIVGDGIREGVEAIAEYLQMHAGLHFSLGLVEMPIYEMSNGDRLVAPRVLARTTLVTRNVVAVPDGYTLQETDFEADDPERSALGALHQAFWAEFLRDLKLDDPEQPKANPAKSSLISFSMPAPISWLSVTRNSRTGEVSVFLSSHRDTPGGSAMQAIVDDWDAVEDQLGGSARVDDTKIRDGRPTIIDSRQFGDLNQPDVRKRAFEWLAERVNTFVNVIRPRIRATAADYQSRAELGA
jgi:hypothetical protein